MSEPLSAGDRIENRYTIEKILGTGGTAIVYQAHDDQENRHVALKVLKNFVSEETVEVRRFRREAEIMRRLSDPDIIQIYDLIWQPTQKILVMELFHGTDLSRFLKKVGPFQLNMFKDVALQICRGLMKCHRQLIIHRDLKPQNILVTEEGRAKISDFGISRLSGANDVTQTGMVTGTLSYIAPECFAIPLLDQRVDIYSLGCLFYEMLAGKPPFPREDIRVMFQKKMNSDYKRLQEFRSDLPKELSTLIDRCLLTNPNLRFQTVFEIVQQLEDLQAAGRSLRPLSIATPKCRACQTQLLEKADFCFNCGRSVEIGFRQGPWAVIVKSCNSPTELSRFIESEWGGEKTKDLDFPFVFVKNIDDPSVQRLADDLRKCGCELVVSQNIRKDMPVKPVYLLFAVLFLLPLFYFQEPVLGLIMVGLAEYFLYRFYDHRISQPVVVPKYTNQRVRGSLAIQWIESISGLKDIRVKALLARAVIEMDSLSLDKGRALEIMKDLLAYAGAMDQDFQVLAATDPVKLKDEILKLKDRFKQEKGTRAAEEILQNCTALERRYAEHRGLSESYQDYFNSLLNFLEMLSRAKSDPNTIAQISVEELKKIAA